MLFLALMTTMSLGLYACQDNTLGTITPVQTLVSTANELAFEVIAKDDRDNDGTSYKGLKPAIIIIRDRSEVELVRDWVQADFISQLESIDYASAFVLAVFQGEKSTSRYSVEVTNVTSSGEAINVYSNFTEPKPGSDLEDVITSPYVLIMVTSELDWEDIATVNLVVDESLLVSHSVK